MKGEPRGVREVIEGGRGGREVTCGRGGLRGGGRGGRTRRRERRAPI